MRSTPRRRGTSDFLLSRVSGNQAMCPSCERFIGPVDACPYCGCDSARSSVYRWLRRLALGIACVGVFLLFWAAHKSEVCTVPIGTIGPQMNFALVHIEGRVERDGYVSPRKGRPSYVSFAVHDGTGQIRVVAYGRVAEEVVAKRLVPGRGWRVSATGTLNVSDGTSVKLQLRRVTDLSVANRGEPGAVQLPREEEEEEKPDP